MAVTVSPSVVGTAATTVASVMTLNLIGVLSAHFPRHASGKIGPSGIVPQNAISSLATIATTIYVPCLTFFSLGSRLSVDVFQESWPLLFWAPFNVILAAALGLLTAWIACVPKAYRKEFIMACSFSNVGAVPLVMTEVLCDQQQLAQEEDCFERGTTFIFMYVFGWSLCFWTVGLVVIRSFGENGRRVTARDSIRGLVNPPMLACLIGAFVGLIAPLRRTIFSDGAPLLFLASAADAYGSSVVGMTTLVMAATLGKSLTSLDPRVWFGCKPVPDSQDKARDTTATPASSTSSSSTYLPPPAGMTANGINALPQALQKDAATFETSAPCSSQGVGEDAVHRPAPSPATMSLPDRFSSIPSSGSVFVFADSEKEGRGDHSRSSLKIGASTSAIVDVDEEIARARARSDSCTEASAAIATPAPSSGEDDRVGVVTQGRWGVRTLLAFVTVSMFVAPAIKFGLVLLLGDHIFTGDNASLLQLVLSIQCVTPTANFVVVVSQREGHRAIAERLSRGVVMQYVSAIVTLLVVTTLAVSYFYSDDADSAGSGDVVQNATATLAATLATDASTASASP